ncbi:hypothetical protein CEXT_416561 [Caerostris extrusa]|uniref:Uncharacterized protein n=1 Tax=Caerostris extrusa TaxID=172846 RepID=A0AAV4XWW6_CAEEX|nr:hypothetical protein CEXT_416561 [Caerostris extrusa]
MEMHISIDCLSFTTFVMKLVKAATTSPTRPNQSCEQFQRFRFELRGLRSEFTKGFSKWRGRPPPPHPHPIVGINLLGVAEVSRYVAPNSSRVVVVKGRKVVSAV